MKKNIAFIMATMLIVANLNVLQAETKKLQLSLQTLDPKTNQVISRTENVNSPNVGVIIVDPWNYHWVHDCL